MHWTEFYFIAEWAVRLVMLFYVPQRRSAAAARTWLLLIFLLPFPGIAAYALFGRIYIARERVAMQERASRRIHDAQEQMPKTFRSAPALPPHLAAVPSLATTLGDFEPFSGNRVELLEDYDGTAARLVEDIDSARDHVHLLFYIFAPDACGKRVAEALVRAAKRGVNCRLLIDAVGSKPALKKLAPALRNAGVTVLAALPVGLFRRNAARFDLRNHRKLAVIDGSIGYTGSQNIVDPGFVKGHPNEELMVRLTGPAVAQLQAVFMADHFFETAKPLDEAGLFPTNDRTGTVSVQAVPSGPGYQRENTQELLLDLLYAARKRVVITTPYFVPDDAVLQAVRSATRRGVAVHLVLSAHANQLVTQLAQRSYYDELLAAGVAVHLYEPRFLHAKHVSIDDHISFIGSANIDIRSFALNAEIGLLLYCPEITARLYAVQERYFAHSHLLNAAEWARRSVWARVLQNTARLADSLL